MFWKKKKDNAKPAETAVKSDSPVSMECGAPLATFMGGYSYDILTSASFKAGDFPDDDAELMNTLVSYIVNAKTKIRDTYKSNGAGYREMFSTGEVAIKFMRQSILVLTPSAVRAVSNDIDMLDRALNIIIIYDRGKRLTRNTVK